MGTLSVLGGLSSLGTGWGRDAAGLGFLQFLAPVLPQAMVVIGALQLVLGYGIWARAGLGLDARGGLRGGPHVAAVTPLTWTGSCQATVAWLECLLLKVAGCAAGST